MDSNVSYAAGFNFKLSLHGTRQLPDDVPLLGAEDPCEQGLGRGKFQKHPCSVGSFLHCPETDLEIHIIGIRMCLPDQVWSISSKAAQ